MTVIDYEAEVKKAAKHVAFNWDGVEEEDLIQDIWVRLLESPGTMNTLYTFDKDAVTRFMYKMAQQVATGEKEKKKIANRDFRYGVNEVRNLLEKGVLDGYQDSVGVGDFDVDRVKTSGYGDSVFITASARADVVDAMKDLRDRNDGRYFDSIVRKYVLHDDLPAGAASMAVSNGLKALTTQMNRKRRRNLGDHNGPGARKAMSNETARDISGAQYSGEELRVAGEEGYY